MRRAEFPQGFPKFATKDAAAKKRTSALKLLLEVNNTIVSNWSCADLS